VNVHTTDYPAGAIRGQLGTSRVFSASLSGLEETPPAALTGRGFADFTINTTTNTVCYVIYARNITLPAVAAHIHKGALGVAGPVVIPLTAPAANGLATGCVTADAALLQDIVANPSGYYVNVHTTEFPAGAIRGQLGPRQP
jgi:hypothetical protein